MLSRATKTILTSYVVLEDIKLRFATDITMKSDAFNHHHYIPSRHTLKPKRLDKDIELCLTWDLKFKNLEERQYLLMFLYLSAEPAAISLELS